MKQRAKKLVIIFGIAVTLASSSIPLSRVKARTSAFDRQSINLNIGIIPYVGVSIVSNNANEAAGVHYSDGAYVKTMQNGEGIENFGTSRLKIMCNIESNDDPELFGGRDCRNDGWSLNVAPVEGYTATVGGKTYAAMIATEHSGYILSDGNSVTGGNSTWLLKVSPVAKSVKGTQVTASVVNGFSNLHAIPATTTPIASSSSWRTIQGEPTYIESFEVDVQYGVGVGDSQGAGTYVGAVEYTVSLNASS